MLLGVNIDHVATLRQARQEGEPDLVSAAKNAIAGGADSITIHLREDRRHIQDQDVYDIRKLKTSLNLEMAATDEMVGIALDVKPNFCCLVPEKRKELTTEGGLDVIGNEEKIAKVIKSLSKADIQVSIFIDPDLNQISVAHRIKAPYIEIHTGSYANASYSTLTQELEKIKKATKYAASLGLKVNAGHGLKYHNVKPIAQIPNIHELNIGHSIISKSIYLGLKEAVQKMKNQITLY